VIDRAATHSSRPARGLSRRTTSRSDVILLPLRRKPRRRPLHGIAAECRGLGSRCSCCFALPTSGASSLRRVLYAIEAGAWSARHNGPSSGTLGHRSHFWRPFAACFAAPFVLWWLLIPRCAEGCGGTGDWRIREDPHTPAQGTLDGSTNGAAKQPREAPEVRRGGPEVPLEGPVCRRAPGAELHRVEGLDGSDERRDVEGKEHEQRDPSPASRDPGKRRASRRRA